MAEKVIPPGATPGAGSNEKVIEFAFGLGDVLTHRGYLGDPVPAALPRLFVLERTAQECPGGVQKHYLCRALCQTAEGASLLSREPLTFNEAELAPFAEAAAGREARLDAMIAAVEKMAEREAGIQAPPAPQAGG